MSARVRPNPTNNQLRRQAEQAALQARRVNQQPLSAANENELAEGLARIPSPRPSLKRRISSALSSAKKSLSSRLGRRSAQITPTPQGLQVRRKNSLNTNLTTLTLPNVPAHPVVPLTREEQEQRFLESPAQFPSALGAIKEQAALEQRRTIAALAEGKLRASAKTSAKKGGSRKNKSKKQKKSKKTKKIQRNKLF